MGQDGWGTQAVGREEEKEKGQKQRRRERVTDLMWQDLTGKSSSVCIHVRHTHAATMIPLFLSCIQSTHIGMGDNCLSISA